MTRENRQTIYKKFMEEIKELNSNLLNRNSTLESNINIDNEEDALSSNNNYEVVSKTVLKDDYLLSNDVNNEQLLKLFGKLKMKDYSPLDLIRFQKQVKNFLLLSFLWFVTLLIKNGINFQNKYIQKMNEEIYYSILNYVLEIIAYYIILFLYLNPKIEFHDLFKILQLIGFVIFMILLYLDLNEYENSEIFLLFSGRLCWTCIFSLLSIITVIIYPIMIRTKGFGWNKSFGFLGSISSIFLNEYKDIKYAIYIFLILEFFSLTLSYGLPSQIGTFILESPSHIPKKKNKEKEKELIEVSNNLFTKKKNSFDSSNSSDSGNQE